jgi:hypothetical protein
VADNIIHVEAMLHLAAMAVAATAAYLGLDHVKMERSSLGAELDRVTAEINLQLRASRILKGDQVQLKDVYDRAFVHVLCHVAKHKMTLGFWRRLGHVFHRQLYVPMLGYFRSRADRLVVMILLGISMVAFFTLTAAACWEITWLYDKETSKWLFVGFVLTILWVFFTIGISFRLQRISRTCKSFLAKVEAFRTDLRTDSATVIESTERATDPARQLPDLPDEGEASE